MTHRLYLSLIHIFAGKYFKQHLVPGEVSELKLDSGYTFEFSEPTVIEIEGIRFGFLVCYDFYFYEAFANMARQKLDIIIGCSHQRSDTHRASQVMSCLLYTSSLNASVAGGIVMYEVARQRSKLKALAPKER